MAVNRGGSGSGSRPTSRERHTSSGSGRSVDRRGGGLNLGGPVGNSGGYEGRPGTGGGGGGGGFPWLLLLVVILCVVGFSNGGDVSGIFEKFVSKVGSSAEKVNVEEVAGGLVERFSRALEGAGVDVRGIVENVTGGNSGGSGTRTGTAAASRSVVEQFTGVLSGNSGIVEALSQSYDPSAITRTGGELINPSQFYWSKNSRGQNVLILTDDEWNQVDTVKLNVFVDDGEGFIDLGLDPLYDFDDDLNLIGEYDGTWLAIDRQPVAFYHLVTIENNDQYRIIGYVPAFLNDQHVNLILVFDTQNPKGYIAGAKVIESGPGTDLTTEQMVSDLIEVKAGDTLDFVCDYYDYNGVFINNYFFGERMTLSKNPEISNVKVPGTLSAVYMITDNNGCRYWTPEM